VLSGAQPSGMPGALRSAMPGAGHPSFVASTPSGGWATRIGDEMVCETVPFIRREGARRAKQRPRRWWLRCPARSA
jgi:hypothetical protein